MATISLNSNIPALDAQRRLGESTAALSTSFDRLSSGLRINRPSDDAAGLSISESLKADTRILHQAVRNVNDGISVLSIADGSLTQLSEIVIRLRELATQSGNGTFSGVQRGALEKEAQALSKEYNRIARTTSFNGVNLFDGTSGETTLQAGYSQLAYTLGGAVGDGTFQTGQTAAVGTGATESAVGDLNGDGNADVVTADRFNQTVSVLLGRGDGTFQTAQQYSTGTNPQAISLGDFNRDGVPDIVTADGTTSNVSVFLGEGDGTFNARQSYSTGLNPSGIAVADFNGDGTSDIATSDFSSDVVSIFLGRGDGTLQARTSYSSTGSPVAIASGDFNYDGKIDLVTADFASANVSVSFGRGDGTFQVRQSYSVGTQPSALGVADFNGDGLLDLVSGDRGSTTLSVLLGRSNGTFQAKQTYAVASAPYKLATADFNGDGAADIVTSDGGSQISVTLNRGDGTFTAGQNYSAGGAAISAADLNGDGVVDIAAANGSNAIQVYLGTSLHGVSALQAFSLATQDGARSAMTYLTKVQSRLSIQRGQIGASQSRAEYVAKGLASSAEEFDAAQSRITNADIADESANLAKGRILQQAGVAVLSQANQGPALALALLR